MSIVLGLVMAAISWWVWPGEVMQQPIASLTLSAIGKLLTSFVFGVWALAAFIQAMDK